MEGRLPASESNRFVEAIDFANCVGNGMSTCWYIVANSTHWNNKYII